MSVHIYTWPGQGVEDWVALYYDAVATYQTYPNLRNPQNPWITESNILGKPTGGTPQFPIIPVNVSSVFICGVWNTLLAPNPTQDYFLFWYVLLYRCSSFIFLFVSYS